MTKPWKMILAHAALTSLAGCGNDPVPDGMRGAQPVCTMLHDRAGARLQGHEATRSALDAFEARLDAVPYVPVPRDEQLIYQRRLEEVRQSTAVVVSLGEEACAAWKGRCKDQLLARNETRLGEQLARLARAAAIMAGDDGCASSPEERAEVARGEACFTIGRRLAVDPEDVTWVSRHWLPTTMPARDEWRPYLDAWKDVTTWRARIDYATALLPVCVPSHARAGCEQITADADTAAPVQLAAILDELEDAFTRGSGCDPTALP